jgi:hypothetical protein
VRGALWRAETARIIAVKHNTAKSNHPMREII